MPDTAAARPSRLALFVPRLFREWGSHFGAAASAEVSGTLLLVDVSGFTALVDRLETSVEGGAEDVAEALEVCFAELVGVAEMFDGDLLFTAGDSLCVLFTGEGHEVRACSVALAMRSRLRALQPLQTSAGPVSLSMSAGVATGRLNLAITGRKQRVPLIGGAVARECTLLQRRCRRGSVLVAPATAGALPSHWLRKDGDAWRLVASEAIMEEPTPAVHLPAPSRWTSTFVPPALRERIAGGARGEYRPTWWGFIRIEGCHGESADTASELWSEAMATADRALTSASEFGVCLVGADFDAEGVRLMLSAGLPESVPDPGERLLWALQRVQAHGHGVAVRATLANGRVYAGEAGTLTRRVYSIVGGTLNLAARLLDVARPGEIVAAQSSVNGMRTRPEVRPLPAKRVKGFPMPQAAAVVVGLRERSRGGAQHQVRFVGREAQLLTLQSSLEEPGSAAVELRGSPGVGKSRLIAEFRARLDEPGYLAECLPYEQDVLYAPFRRLCRQIAGIPDSADEASAGATLRQLAEADPELEPWLPFLAVVVNASVPETDASRAIVTSFRPQRIRETVLHFLDRSISGRALIFFEDVHWMDEASVGILNFLLEAAGGRSWRFYITRRTDNTGWVAQEGRLAIPFNTIVLSPLSTPGAVELALAATEDRPLPAHTLHEIAEHSGGNPLYILELAEAAQATGALPRQLPEKVENLADSAIDRLPNTDRELIRDASAFGLRFHLQALGALLARLGTRPAISVLEWRPPEDCVRAVGPGEFEFRHVLIRDAAHDGLSKRRRRALHGAIGEALESEPGASSPGALVYHFSEAGDYERTWHYASRAATDALARDAPADGAKYLQIGIRAAERLPTVSAPELAQSLEKLAGALLVSGSMQAAAAASDALARAGALVHGEPTVTARLLRKQGEAEERRGLWEASLGFYRSALELLPAEARDPSVLEQRAEVCLAYAGVLHRLGDQEGCASWAQDAVGLADTVHSESAKAHAYCLLHLASLHRSAEDAERYRNLALQLVNQLADPVLAARIFNNAGYELHYIKGHWDEGLGYYRRSLEIRARIGDSVGQAMVGNNIAEILLDQGRYDEAEAMFRESLWAARAAGYRLGVALIRRNVGMLSLRRGNVAEARATLTDALHELTDLHADARNILTTRARLAECMLASGDLSAAALEIAAIRANLRPENRYPGAEADLTRLDGFISLAKGEREIAARAFGDSLASAAREGLPFEEAVSLLASARAGVGEAAESRALAIMERLGVVQPPTVHVPSHGVG